MAIASYVDRQVRVRDLNLNYEEWGDPAALAIVMLHGFGVSGHMFDEFAERAKDRFHLIALDQRGHGDSDWAPDGDYSRDAFVADFEAFREALGLERFILVGHSMGGLNAVSYAARYPHRLRALILVDVGPEAAKEGVDNIVRFTRGPDELEFDQFVEMAHRFNPRRTVENIRERMRHRLRQQENGKWTWKFDKRFRQPDGLRVGSELTNDDMWQLYRSVETATLLVRGAESDVLTQEVAERAAAEMPRCRLVVVPAAGHSVPGDNPDDFTAAVRQFLSDLESGLFAPETDAIPPLHDLVESHNGHRTGSAVGLLIAAAAALAVVGLVIGVKRRRRPAPPAASIAKAAAPLRAAIDSRVGSVDLDAVRHRALTLAHELAQVSRPATSKAMARAHDLHLERARETAAHLLHDLGDRTLASSPAIVRAAAHKVEHEVHARAHLPQRRPKRFGAVRFAVKLLPLAFGLRKANKAKKKGLRGWRR